MADNAKKFIVPHELYLDGSPVPFVTVFKKDGTKVVEILGDGTITFAEGVSQDSIDVTDSFTTGANSTVGFFGAEAVGQAEGLEVEEAGAEYTADEQAMINKVYTVLKNLGFIGEFPEE